MNNTKRLKLLSLPRFLAAVGLFLLIIASYTYPLAAQTVTQGYNTDSILQKGTIVKLIKSDATKVEAVTTETAQDMFGVVVDANDAPVTLSQEGQKVFIANSGHFSVLVSDQNGKIATGDYITISAIAGIGMKASIKDVYVIGRALGNFDGSDLDAISTTSIKDSQGNSKEIHIGRIQEADIAVAKNPLLKSSEPNLPVFLRKATEALAGKPVSAAKAYISLVIFTLSVILAGVLMYSGIRSGIISVGRNPLSKRSIIRGMMQVVLTGLIIFTAGLFGVYLLLKL